MKRIVYINGIELTQKNYEKLLGYGTSLERAVDNACDAFYDGTTETDRRQGITTQHYCDKIFIIET